MSWGALGGVLGGVAAVIAAIVGYASLKAKREADRATAAAAQGAQELAGVKVSIDSLTAALARADADREILANELHDEREAHTVTRAELVQLRTEFTEYKRAATDRVKVLARQLREIGGDTSQQEEPADD